MNLNKKQLVIVILFILLSIELIPVINYDRTTLELSYFVNIQNNEHKNFTLLLPIVEVISNYKFYPEPHNFQIIRNGSRRSLLLSSNQTISISAYFKETRSLLLNGGYYDHPNTYLDSQDPQSNINQSFFIYLDPTSEVENLNIKLMCNRTENDLDAFIFYDVLINGTIKGGWNRMINQNEGEMVGDTFRLLCLIPIIMITILIIVIYLFLNFNIIFKPPHSGEHEETEVLENPHNKK